MVIHKAAANMFSHFITLFYDALSTIDIMQRRMIV
jgi:hypothetical protein